MGWKTTLGLKIILRGNTDSCVNGMNLILNSLRTVILSFSCSAYQALSNTLIDNFKTGQYLLQYFLEIMDSYWELIGHLHVIFFRYKDTFLYIKA
jgi:hypothetical protein